MNFLPLAVVPSGAAQPNILVQAFPLVLLVLVFYFLLIRPQQQQRKQHLAMLAKLEKNDEVVTTGGLHATILSVGEQTIVARIADNVKVEIEKSSVLHVKK